MPTLPLGEDGPDEPSALRAAMMETLSAGGQVRSPSVHQAMARVERHHFVPEVSVVDAYAPTDAVIIKRDRDGAALSSASAPDIVATMLELLEVAPGHRVLEIGTGTGYNAALLDELVGDDGQIVTVDIDGDVVERARRALARSGHRAVVALAHDGTQPVGGQKPFDRIILTAGAWDIPPAWFEQLAPAGRLVLPLRWRGQSQLVALHATSRTPGAEGTELLVGTAAGRCEFITLVGALGERTIQLDQDSKVSLSFDPDQGVRPELLTAALTSAPEHRWSGITIDRSASIGPFWLQLSAREPSTCRIAAADASTRAQLPAPMHPADAPALVEGSSMSYLTARTSSPATTDNVVELGAASYGPDGARLAHQIVEHLQAWDGGYLPQPELSVQLVGPSPPPAVRSAITKTHSTLTLTTEPGGQFSKNPSGSTFQDR